MYRPRRTAFLLALGFAAGVAVAAAGVHFWPVTGRPGPPRTPAPRLEEVRPVAELSEAFIAMARAITPAVVRIESEKLTRDPHAGLSPRMRDMFGIPPIDTMATRPVPEIAGGTGIIVSGDGYILTNNHVVSGATHIMVTLHDKRAYEAKLVGADPTTDIAVIRIPAHGLTAARLGDSDSTRVGEWVLAVGNPGFGRTSTLDFTVTSGIISAKGRPLDILGRELRREDDPAARYAIEDFIQTDAVINPGNSGGPLVDLHGEVVGINTAIASGTGYYEGYGFAIPINLAHRVMSDLIEYGVVRRPVLGVTIRNVTAEDAQVYKLPGISGVLIQDFSGANSPAEAAGLQRGDVVVAIDSQTVDRVGQLQRLVAQHRPGEVVRLRVVRYGRTLTMVVQLAQAPIDQVPEPPHTRRSAATATVGLGIRIAEMSPRLARDLGFTHPGGAVITAVAVGSVGERAGLVRGLRIVSIGHTRIESAPQARSQLAALHTDQIASLLLEQPDGSTVIVNLRVP